MADDALQQANALITLQAAEIERLRAQISGEQIAGELRHWLTHVVTAGSLDDSPSVDVSALASILDVLVSRRILDSRGGFDGENRARANL